MHNQNVVMIQPQDATDYRYDLVAHRKHQGDKVTVEQDYIEMVWQGFQIDHSKVVMDQI